MPNLQLGGKDALVASKNSLSSFAFKSLSLCLSQDEFVSILSVVSQWMHFRRIDFYEWFSIYLRRSSTRRCTAQGSILNRRSPPRATSVAPPPPWSLPPAFCQLAIPAKTHSTCGVLNYSSKHNRTFITAVLMGNFSASPYSLISTITIIVRPGRSVWRRY